MVLGVRQAVLLPSPHQTSLSPEPVMTSELGVKYCEYVCGLVKPHTSVDRRRPKRHGMMDFFIIGVNIVCRTILLCACVCARVFYKQMS